MQALNGETDKDAFIRNVIGVMSMESRAPTLDAIRSLWRMGDLVGRLRAGTRPGDWARSRELCAARLCVHPASLEEALRAAIAFPAPEREPLLGRFCASETLLTRSHVVALSRATTWQRAKAIAALLVRSYSVRELREYLREMRCDRHRIDRSNITTS